jgi:hypothetical protein
LTARVEAADEVRAGQVFVARNRDERPLQLERHEFEKARLPAAGRAFQHHRQALPVGGFEHRNLVALRLVVRRHVSRLRRLDDVALDAAYTINCCLHQSPVKISRQGAKNAKKT